MMYGRFPLSLRAVEDLLFERGIDICHETVRFWWNRFGPMFASEILRERVSRMREIRHWRWHLDEVFVKINGEQHYLWRAVDHEGEVLESHLPFRRREHAMQRFRRMKSLQKFASVQASLHNHFNQERLLTNRQTYKERRSAALAEWRSLIA